MRVEPFSVGSFLHVVKRGTRGTPIVRQEADRARFVRLLFYLNDEFQSSFWEQAVRRLPLFERLAAWPERKPLVDVVAWTLMPNHFHLLLHERIEGGASRFMQRLCGSMSRHFNEKYQERGSIFQGAYRSKTIDTDEYLRWVIPYILVKNVFELYPGGFEKAVREFDKAWRWGVNAYQYASLRDFALCEPSPILEKSLFHELIELFADFKSDARDMVLTKLAAAESTAGGVLFE